MKVFITWSGDASHHIAKAFHGWLPRVIQSIEPFISCTDIDKGKRWQNEIAVQLEASDAGIVCLTPDNLTAPWLLFEAGALSKRTGASRVCTFLFNLDPLSVQWPLTQFQPTVAAKDEVLKMMQTLNSAAEPPLEGKLLTDSVELFWPELEGQLHGTPRPSAASPERPTDDMMKEILSTLRNYVRQSEPSDEVRRLIQEFWQVLGKFVGPTSWLGNYEVSTALNETILANSDAGVLRGWVTELGKDFVLTAPSKDIISEFDQLIKGKFFEWISEYFGPHRDFGIQDVQLSLTETGVEQLRRIANRPPSYHGSCSPNITRPWPA